MITRKQTHNLKHEIEVAISIIKDLFGVMFLAVVISLTIVYETVSSVICVQPRQ